ncbi:hypothetical protein KC19_VG148500 [Ceratodon purpureus]|uniref:Uncharacterized protein n=1 Tax=Ceratodon purpureus TaxID=3225 RepID=A0A8T0HQM4_CERPU|nr:hypothetical protein KC19_VG148500 [Ceratodon purpureus]
MQHSIELLYQATHQKPIGKVKAFGVAFARGLIAEKLGYAVDWAGYAMKACRRGKKASKPFESFEDMKAKCARGEGKWPENEVQRGGEENLEGAPDDWAINRNARKFTAAATYNLTFYMNPKPSKVVARPLWGNTVAANSGGVSVACAPTDPKPNRHGAFGRPDRKGKRSAPQQKRKLVYHSDSSDEDSTFVPMSPIIGRGTLSQIHSENTTRLLSNTCDSNSNHRASLMLQVQLLGVDRLNLAKAQTPMTYIRGNDADPHEQNVGQGEVAPYDIGTNQFGLEDAGMTTPPFSPLRKRLLPLSTPEDLGRGTKGKEIVLSDDDYP